MDVSIQLDLMLIAPSANKKILKVDPCTYSLVMLIAFSGLM